MKERVKRPAIEFSVSKDLWAWIPLGSAVLTLVVFLDVGVPALRHAWDAWGEERAIKAELAELQRWAQDREALAGYRDALERRYQQTVVSLPDGGDMSQVLALFQGIADANQIRLLSVRPGGLMVEEDHQTLPVSLETRGTFTQIVHFVHAAERSSYLVRIESVHLAAPATTNEEIEATVEAVVVVVGKGGVGNAANLFKP